jgi:hypothetical protein
MIWYSLEILFVLFMLFVAFFVYRVLVNSPKFTRFIERTKGTDETNLGDIHVKLDVAEEQADQVAKEVGQKIKDQAKALRRLKRRGL